MTLLRRVRAEPSPVGAGQGVCAVSWEGQAMCVYERKGHGFAGAAF